jgi:hypothetical protein
MLAVEGPHDRWIIDELLREELERVHACIVPMYGGKETPGLGTAGVLHEFTDWVMIPVWDNLRATLLASTWAELEIIVAAGGDDAAIASLLDAHLKGLGSEGKFARQFMRLAATSGQLHRFASPYALSRKDVLHYLPPRSLSQRMPATWGDVDVARAANGEASEKVFICTRYGLDLLEPEVRRAAASMDSVPGDLLGLISMLQQLEDERRS